MTRLPANKWVTIGSCFGLAQRLLHVVVDADFECKWRERIGWFVTSSGSLRRSHSFRLFNQTAQIWSPVEMSYDSHDDRAPDIVPVPHQFGAPSSVLGGRQERQRSAMGHSPSDMERPISSARKISGLRKVRSSAAI
jgi:hypothetical protein